MQPLFYDRTFNKATAGLGETVQVRINLFFIAPSSSDGYWFQNIQDNLGGSFPLGGPFAGGNANLITIEQNITDHNDHRKIVGNPGSEGILRMWAGGGSDCPSFPCNPINHNRRYHATAGNHPSSITFFFDLVVKNEASFGTVITVPTRVPLDANFWDPNTMMIETGPKFGLFILNTTPQPGWSRTLTIV